MLFWKLGLVNIWFIAKVKQEQLHQYFKILVSRSSHSPLQGTNQHQQLHLLKIVFLLFSSSLLYLLYLSNLVDISQIYTYCWIFDKPTWYHCRNPMDMVHQFWLEHISGKMWKLSTSRHWVYLLEDWLYTNCRTHNIQHLYNIEHTLKERLRNIHEKNLINLFPTLKRCFCFWVSLLHTIARFPIWELFKINF